MLHQRCHQTLWWKMSWWINRNRARNKENIKIDDLAFSYLCNVSVGDQDSLIDITIRRLVYYFINQSEISNLSTNQRLVYLFETSQSGECDQVWTGNILLHQPQYHPPPTLRTPLHHHHSQDSPCLENNQSEIGQYCINQSEIKVSIVVSTNQR